jgi:hypothetical protein
MRSFIVTAAIAIVLNIGAPAAADEHRMESDYVVLEGGQELAAGVLHAVAGTVKPMLPAWKEAAEDVAEPVIVALSMESNGRLSQDASIATLRVYINQALHPTDEQARQMWELARNELEAALRRVQAMGSESRLRQADREMEQLAEQRANAELEAAKLQEELFTRASPAAGSAENLIRGLGEALSRQRELQLNEAGLQARRKAIESRIDQLRAEAEAAAKDDDVIKELRKLVDIREKGVARARAATDVGKALTPVLNEAEGQLAQAKIELLRAVREATERAGGGTLRGMNDELMQLMVRAAEIEAQQKALGAMIDELRAALQQSMHAQAEIGQLEQKLAMLRERYRQVESRLFEKQQQLAEMPRSEISLRPLVPRDEKPTEEAEK